MSFRGIVTKKGKILAEFNSTVYVPCTKLTQQDDCKIDYDRLNAKQLKRKIAFYQNQDADPETNHTLRDALTGLEQLKATRAQLKSGEITYNDIPVAKTPEECGEKRKAVWHGYTVNLDTALASVKKQQSEEAEKRKLYAEKTKWFSIGNTMPRMQ